jgi:DNA-binding Lrp family transcriptional regulator
MLRSVGIDQLEERVYVEVLKMSRPTLQDLAQAGDASLAKVRRAVASLEKKGLVSRCAGKGSRLVATRPDLGIEALILQREEELRGVRLLAQKFLEDFWSRPPGPSPAELVEVIVGRDAVAQRVAQLLRSVKGEVLAFDKPPYTDSHHVAEGAEAESIRVGGVWRGIYDQSALQAPGLLESLRRMVAAGEQARVLQGLPIKLLIVDRRSALLPLTVGAETALESAVEVHPSALLEALVALFDTLWERATPVRPFRASDGPAEDQLLLPEEDQLLMTLLAAGFKDQAIARRMGVGVRTVRRRIQLLLMRLGASTRFQAGLQAAEQMWLREESGH